MTGSRDEEEDDMQPLAVPASFPFPYPQPYDIQLQLMQTVFKAIEERKIAIVESPTGTGKSLTLLTSTLSWLEQNKKRLEDADEAKMRAKLAEDDPDDPPWVINAAVKRLLADRQAVRAEKEERLQRARERERQLRRANTLGAFRNGERKRPKVAVNGAKEEQEKDEDQFLPEDVGMQQESSDDGIYLSKEVREMMAKYDAGRPKLEVEESEDDMPKIYYTSRTHTQLRQLTSELLKTEFVHHEETTGSGTVEASSSKINVSMVPLGSRKQLCINDKIRALGKSGGDERMNEACLEMQKAGKDRCEYLPSKDQESLMLDARDSILANVKDIEDIVTSSRKSCVCPYYSTRRAVKQAQIVTLPYNLLLQKNAREALNVDLTNQIIVIDEAHNLIDTLLSIHSNTLTFSQISTATSQVQQYLSRFKSRLKSVHALWFQQTLAVLQGLGRVCEEVLIAHGKGSKKSEMLTTSALVERLGKGADQVNLMEMVKYLKDSKLARKISGFVEKTSEDLAKKHGKTPNAAARHASIAAFHQVEGFLLSLTDSKDDGRVLLSVEEGNDRKKVVMKYILLNPAERFKEVVEQARSVILAGGTMEPISDFFIQLFPSIPRDRFATLSCAHSIPKSNLLTQVICRGPRKIDLEFKFSNRGDESLLTELGSVIQSTIGLVPHGVVVFLPSYSFLDQIKKAWGKSGLMDRLNAKKQIFYEPQTSGDAESILRDYALAISSIGAGQGSKRTGALMFAVVGGKLSEGINFSDNLGRCVIMVGLPFANVGSTELQERMKYVESLPGAGKDAAKELYENLCMRAVNQSIGRAIRHANDYATILLIDKRFAQARIRNKLPKWIGEDVKVQEEYGGATRAIAAFFKDKRERGLT